MNFPINPTIGQEYTIANKTWVFNSKGWEAKSSGSTGTSNYNDLTNKPSINNIQLSGNKSSLDLGLATAAQGAKADTALQSLPSGIIIDANYVHTDNNYTDAAVLEVEKIAGKANQSTEEVIDPDTGEQATVDVHLAAFAGSAGSAFYADFAVYDFQGNQIDLHYATQAELESVADEVANKVDKVAGSSLVPDTEITKLSQYPLFENIPLGGGGTNAAVYLTDTASDIAGYKKLAYAPLATETVRTITANNNTVSGLAYLFDLPIDLNQFPAGTIELGMYNFVSNTSNDSRFIIDFFVRSSAGVEVAVGSLTGGSIEWTSRQVQTIVNSVYSATAIDPLGRFGCRIKFSTTRTSNTTLSYVEGDGQGLFFRLPIAMAHASNRRKNAELQYQHFDATVEKTTPITADSVGLWDSVTSTFKRLSLTNMLTWLNGSYVTISQSVAQSIGTTSNRLSKLWAINIESTNMPTVGGVDLRTELGVEHIQYFEIEKKGDGTGILQMNITVLYAGTATITGGFFYDNLAGTGESTTKALVKGDNSIYMKTSSYAIVKVFGLNKIRNSGTNGTNIPRLRMIQFNSITNYLYMLDFDNSLGGQIAIPSVCTYFSLTGSNTVSGVLTIPSVCTTFSLAGSNTVSGVLTIPSVCTFFVLVGLNTVSGLLTIPSVCTYFTLTGANTVSGLLTIPSVCTTFSLAGSNTVSGVLTIPSVCTYFNLQGSNTVSGVLSISSVCTYFNLQGSNTVSGVLSISSVCTFFVLAGANSCIYNLTNTPDATKYIELNSAAGVYTYNTTFGGKVWAQNMRRLYIRPKTATWTSEMTDALLIDLALVTVWTNEKTIDLRGNCGARTAASTAAVSTLTANGVTVLTN